MFSDNRLSTKLIEGSLGVIIVIIAIVLTALAVVAFPVTVAIAAIKSGVFKLGRSQLTPRFDIFGTLACIMMFGFWLDAVFYFIVKAPFQTALLSTLLFVAPLCIYTGSMLARDAFSWVTKRFHHPSTA